MIRMDHICPCVELSISRQPLLSPFKIKKSTKVFTLVESKLPDFSNYVQALASQGLKVALGYALNRHILLTSESCLHVFAAATLGKTKSLW